MIAVRRSFEIGELPPALATNRRGSTLVEFAIVAPAFFALLIATLQTALTMFTQQAIQSAAEYAARRLSVGDPQKANENATTFKTSLCGQLPDYLNCTKLLVDVRSADTLPALDTSSPITDRNGDGTYKGTTGYSPGGPNSYVIIRLLYVWNTTLGPLNFDLSNLGKGQRLVIGTLVVKTEPYNP